MSLSWFRGDERPAWKPPAPVGGISEDLSTGHTFRVTLTRNGAVALTKTTGITGAAGGAVTVQWAVGDLTLDPGAYTAQLTVTRTVDSFEWTVEEPVLIKARN